MCDKSVSTYPLTIKFVTECIMTEEMCDKVFAFDSIPDQYKTQEMCDKVVCENLFLIVYCSDKCKTVVWSVMKLLIIF